ncbi:MAG: cytochrome-c oxidase, cbb3-type subunit I [Deltaproteobacteria bacterium]|nr:cytochrome-c oxidase, cbb3-type subunit I [Deltaproteobacteria bacterium]MCB9786420.1 cytochrome-c oxidase, cbb3-type subunit I [Deltaproteobacteria bacterium]
MREVSVTYDDRSVRLFLWASVLWALVGMLVGLLIATQLAFFQANFDVPWLTFGRLRPLHTNAVIFAFVGNMLFAGVYYSTQRLTKARMASDFLSKFHFWGWQLIIVAAAITLPLGISQGKEYAELEWPIDIAIALVWVAFAVNFFWTLANRREKHLYVALWFYIATIVTVAVLHIVNSLALPVLAGLESYPVYAGVQDALVQWWYGHNAVAFFLTTPILGIMYYFLPKAAERPVYSYRLSIIHFWSLVFLYIWAGPHHLLYTALPEWAQSMGMIFSVMLWAPSWGGMLNGLLTLRGAWDKLRTDPVIKFLIAGVTFYGMATFEGPLLSIKSVSGLGHYTDWIIGHVHTGALGWNGFMAAGMFYWLVPRLFGTKLHSKGAADFHFWLGTLGILLYAIAMWVSGISQGLMWRAVDGEGALLYPNFVETVIAVRPLYIMRIVGGLFYFAGFCLMAWNLVKTARSGKAVDVTVTVVEDEPAPKVPWTSIVFGKPMLLAYFGIVVTIVFLATDAAVAAATAVVLVLMFLAAWKLFGKRMGGEHAGHNFHRALEGRALLFTVFVVLSVLVGGIVEIIPTLTIAEAVPITGSVQRPYTALELQGRDAYVNEGCYTCHSQMIRPFVSEVMRYGDASRPGESMYDRPFQWGSKRTGPDLARVGGKYPNLWHFQHMTDPRSTSPGSVMPPYDWMADRRIDIGDSAVKLRAMKTLGVPYTDDDIAEASRRAEADGRALAADLSSQGVAVPWDSEMVAIIAYLQAVGKNTGLPVTTSAAVSGLTPAKANP